MESPYYEMTHDFEEENRLFQSGYAKGYHDAVMRCPDIVRCKDCVCYKDCIFWNGSHAKYCEKHSLYPDENWFCADGERKPTQTKAK